MGSGGQLDLFGGGGAAAVALRWVPVDAPGRLGLGPLDQDLGALRAEHKVQVVVAVAADPAAVVERAAPEGIDVRHLAPERALPALRRHAVALSADARAGRRVVVLAEDPASAALPVAAALIELGVTFAAASEALGVDTLGDEGRATLLRYAGG